MEIYISAFLDPICQIAVDNTRNILYGRTKSGSIQVGCFLCLKNIVMFIF